MVSNFHFRLNVLRGVVPIYCFWVPKIQVRSLVGANCQYALCGPSSRGDSFVDTESAQAVIIYDSVVIYGFMLEGIRVVFRAETGGVLTQIQRISLVFSWLYSCGCLPLNRT